MKLGLIRCIQTEDMCPSITCLKVIQNKEGAFEGIEESIELIGINTCGGCPGKKAVSRATKMVKLGANAIALGSCFKKGAPIGFQCPYFDQIAECIKARNKHIQFFEWTH